jgi:putative copper resistance protein D
MSVSPSFASAALVSIVRSPGEPATGYLTKWQTDPFAVTALVVLVVLGLSYLVGVRRLAAKGRKWSRLRTASFLLGILSVVIALDSGLAYYAKLVFNTHTIQHTLLMYMGPVLFALSAPMTLWLQASGRKTQTLLLKFLNNKVFEALTFPILVAAFSYSLMLAYFLSDLFSFSEAHPLFLNFINVLFVVAGCVYWWPVVGLDHSRWTLSFPAKLGYLATAIPVTTFLGLGLLSATTSIDPKIYTLADTHAGGGTLWVLGELFSLGAMGAVMVALMHSEERENRRYDRRLAHEEANLEREKQWAAAGISQQQESSS